MTMSDAAVLMPEAFNERFTVYLNSAGKPVERTLSQMTSGEVLFAIRWHADETERLERDAEPAKVIAIAIEEGRTADLAHMTRGELLAGRDALRRSIEASQQLGRLIHLVHTSMPQWRGELPLDKAVRKFWPR